MISIRTLSLYSFLALNLSSLSVHASSAHHDVQQGNTLYEQQQYQKAAEHYANAAIKRPDTSEIQFNQGNAAFKQQDYAKALEHYTQALKTTNPKLESQTKYNLGNVKYQQALQSMTKPQDATNHLRTATTYYRDSLDVNPDQKNARYNLELAKHLLHQLQQQQQSQDKQPQNDSDNRGNQSQQNTAQPSHLSPNQGSQPDQRQDEQSQSKQQQQAQDEPRKPPEQAKANSIPQPVTEDNTEDSPVTKPQKVQELTPEEADHLLNAIRERAREANHQRQQRRARMRTIQVEKDW